MRSRDGLIRHVIFDLDGTLIDSCAVCVDILADMLVERGSSDEIDPVDARMYMSRGGREMVAALLGSVCTDPDVDLADFRSRYAMRRTPIETVYPGVAAGLRRLQDAGLVLAICSNKPQALCEKVLADTGLADYFAVVIGGQSGLRPKPAPDLIDATLAQLQADADTCLFVGDSELDDAIARTAGIPFYFLSYGYAERGWRHPGELTFDSFEAATAAIIACHVHA